MARQKRKAAGTGSLPSATAQPRSTVTSHVSTLTAESQFSRREIRCLSRALGLDDNLLCGHCRKSATARLEQELSEWVSFYAKLTEDSIGSVKKALAKRGNVYTSYIVQLYVEIRTVCYWSRRLIDDPFHESLDGYADTRKRLISVSV